MCDDTRTANILANLDLNEYLRLTRTLVGIGFLDSSYCISDSANLAKIYAKFLTIVPEDEDVYFMGLDRVLGLPKTVVSVRPTGVVNTICLAEVVAWVNSAVMHYLEWYFDHSITYGELVMFLSETIGLYAMRRILLSLLHYIQLHKDEDNTSMTIAQSLSNALEDYLEHHKGEDETVRTFELGKANTLKYVSK
jgi:hypothetical protein